MIEMNFYDNVHNLVRSFKETEEYKEYIKQKDKIKKESSEFEALKTFKNEQRQHQIEYINTGKINEEKQLKLQKDYNKLIQNEDIKKLLESEIRLDVLLADMQKIIADGIKEIIEF